MKLWNCLSVFTLFFFAGICSAQRPAPPLAVPSNELSADFLLPIKDQTHIGLGGQLTSAHFFGDNLGLQLQGDYLSTDEYGLQDAGVRVGPIVRFWSQHSIQPYVHTLFGYARVKASYLQPAGSYRNSGSFLGGGGLEFPLSGGWSGRIGADLEGDGGARTRAGRVLAGVSYHFNGRRPQR